MNNLDEILRRVYAGEITPEQAEQKLKPKRGRPKKYPDKNTQRQDGDGGVTLGITLAPCRSRARETPRNLAIGKHYVDQVDSDIKPMKAMWNTLKLYHSKRSPLSAGTVSKYATAWRKRRQRDIIRRKGMLEAIRKGMEALNAMPEEEDDMP